MLVIVQFLHPLVAASVIFAENLFNTSFSSTNLLITLYDFYSVTRTLVQSDVFK
jgi:hypothetical protein